MTTTADHDTPAPRTGVAAFIERNRRRARAANALRPALPESNAAPDAPQSAVAARLERNRREAQAGNALRRGVR